MIAYHGSVSVFDKFNTDPRNQLGAHFSIEKKVAEIFSDPGYLLKQ